MRHSSHISDEAKPNRLDCGYCWGCDFLSMILMVLSQEDKLFSLHESIAAQSVIVNAAR